MEAWDGGNGFIRSSNNNRLTLIIQGDKKWATPMVCFNIRCTIRNTFMHFNHKYIYIYIQIHCHTQNFEKPQRRHKKMPFCGKSLCILHFIFQSRGLYQAQVLISCMNIVAIMPVVIVGHQYYWFHLRKYHRLVFIFPNSRSSFNNCFVLFYNYFIIMHLPNIFLCLGVNVGRMTLTSMFWPFLW